MTEQSLGILSRIAMALTKQVARHRRQIERQALMIEVLKGEVDDLRRGVRNLKQTARRLRKKKAGATYPRLRPRVGSPGRPTHG